MFKTITLIIILLVPGLWTLSPSFAGPGQDPSLLMQEHIKKVKDTNPADYQVMVEDAGGNIAGCLSCHKKEDNKKSHFRFKKSIVPSK